MPIIGIDLGTTNSLITVWKDSDCILIPNNLNRYFTPSVVGLDENGEILVGDIAKERLISYPDKTVAGFKRFMGTDRKFSLGEKSFTAPELSSFLLKQLREDAQMFLGETITEAVISVPAYFNDNQRAATKLAGKLAGLKVNRLVNEPSAAALAYWEEEEEETFLVFDFGGGTLDVSLVEIFENVIEIVAVAGDNHLGGDDFNDIIVDCFCKHFQLEKALLTKEFLAILYRQAELCKIQLTTQETADMTAIIDGKQQTFTMTNHQLIAESVNLFNQMGLPIEKVLHDSLYEIAQIDKVILVGGSSRMPVVKNYITHVMRKLPTYNYSPDTIVAIGTGIYAGIIERNEKIKDIVLMDICPFTLGVAVCGVREGEGRMSPIIERNSTLPCSRVERYMTTKDNQPLIKVEIYQGEHRLVRDNLKLGEIEVPVTPAKKGEIEVDIRFTYDINGILEVDIVDLFEGKKISQLIVNKSIQMTEEELIKRREELSVLKIHPREKEKNRLLLARAERLYEENLGEVRKFIDNITYEFGLALESQNEKRITKGIELVEELFDIVESSPKFLIMENIQKTLAGREKPYI